MGNDIRVIIFDLGRVLIDFDHWIAVRKVASLAKRPAEDIYKLFFDSALIQDFESGRISPRVFFTRLRDMIGLDIRYEQFLPIWNGIFFLTGENKKVYSLAKRLKRTYRLALLSNINELHCTYLKKNFPVFDAFHHFFTSYELGCIKPSLRIYRTVLAYLKVEPRQVFYVDDRRELIEQARGLGIRAFVFTGVGQLKKDLASCGIV